MLQRFFADQCPQQAAAIAHRVLFPTAPLAIILVSIFAIGFATSFVGSELPSSGTTPFTSNVYMPSVIYLAVIVALLFRPDGLFARGGHGAVERV